MDTASAERVKDEIPFEGRGIINTGENENGILCSVPPVPHDTSIFLAFPENL